MDKRIPQRQEHEEEGIKLGELMSERTLVLIKPDGVKRRLVGKIINRFEEKGLKIVSMKFMLLTKPQAEKHYSVHKDKPFFRGLVDYIISGPIVAMIVEGNSAISVVRLMAGSTDGSKAAPGTIRGDFSSSVQNNIVHASDSVDSYNYESQIFFNQTEIIESEYGDESLL